MLAWQLCPGHQAGHRGIQLAWFGRFLRVLPQSTFDNLSSIYSKALAPKFRFKSNADAKFSHNALQPKIFILISPTIGDGSTKKVYDLYGADTNVQCWESNTSHGYKQDKRERMYGWV